jgi:U3 small nucleolar RNA-associated protein 5
METGYDEKNDEATSRELGEELDVDLAELSLGQRLATVTDLNRHQPSDSESEDVTNSRNLRVTNKQQKSELDIVPANSLTRTLIQALHSSDTKLIETCLAHSNSDLIRNTVKRLPCQLAIPLLNACVERLGRGARAANMKGGGAGASAQRGMTLITWIRTVLTVHMGHLLTVSPFL